MTCGYNQAVIWSQKILAKKILIDPKPRLRPALPLSTMWTAALDGFGLPHLSALSMDAFQQHEMLIWPASTTFWRTDLLLLIWFNLMIQVLVQRQQQLSSKWVKEVVARSMMKTVVASTHDIAIPPRQQEAKSSQPWAIETNVSAICW